MKKIKVLLVDDSAVVRQVLQAVLDQEPDIQVIGAASDPIFAMEKMTREWPDVIVLDVEMPRMDGITFLKKIMAEHPTPVVICSTLTEKGAETTIQALSAGAGHCRQYRYRRWSACTRRCRRGRRKSRHRARVDLHHAYRGRRRRAADFRRGKRGRSAGGNRRAAHRRWWDPLLG